MMSLQQVVEGDETYDMEKEEPESEITFSSTLLEHVARRNMSMSLWRSHGMSSERPLYIHPHDMEDSTAVDGDESTEQNETENDELDDWCSDEKCSGELSYLRVTMKTCVILFIGLHHVALFK
jgi:hypothetical protein